MAIEAAPVDSPAPPSRRRDAAWSLQWTPIVVGALTATALSSILITFAATVGLGVSSSAPTWRDASWALWLLSGIYLILQALISFGCGGYVAGRTQAPTDPAHTDDVERRDGFHGIAAWALAVVLSALLAAFIGMAAGRPSTLATPPSATEPSVLSYEIDQLFRAGRNRPANFDLTPARAEAGRILLTSSSHSGVTAEDRGYLVQMVNGATGLTAADAERRVDNVISDSRRAIRRARASTVILAFSIATALLLAAGAAWAGAEAGGRHRDGMPLPRWMTRSNALGRRRAGIWQRPASPMP
jgi:hypothetical protein